MSGLEPPIDGVSGRVSADKAGQAEMGTFRALVGGSWVETGDALEVRSPYDGALIAVVHRARSSEVDSAIAAAGDGFAFTRKLACWQRSEILEKISAGIARRSEEFARTIALEAAKPIRTARSEVDRAVFTFKVAAEEAKRLPAEAIALDWLPGTEGRRGYVHRVPLGPIAGITPFNFPLNLVAHKVAPALAAGNPIIIRPSSQTPVSALKLAEVVLEAGWPGAALSVIPCSVDAVAALVEDERIKMLSFTGSPAVGWDLKKRAGKKRVTLELGGNAAVIVHKDADLPYAALRIAQGGFSHAGQSCISAQRIYIHSSVYQAFRDDLVSRVKALKLGDPLDDATDLGPVIDLGAACRVESWVKEAVDTGARVLTGGRREGNMFEATLLENVDEDARIACREAFAPVVVLAVYDDIAEAIRLVNRSDYGLQAGLFTNDLSAIQAAFDIIEVGGLMVNDVSAFRVDHMPYGGVKLSGFGREGLRYAIEEMTEMKLLMINPRPPIG